MPHPSPHPYENHIFFQWGQGGPLGPCPHNGVGRAPTPYGHPKGAHYRSRFIFISARPPFGLPALMAPFGCHMENLRFSIIMHTPSGCAYGVGALPTPLMGHPLGCPICAPLRGAHYITRVRVYVKPLRGNLGHFTRDLGQN